MSDEKKAPSGGAIKAVYTDVASPAAREVGTTLGRAVRLALVPLNGALWSIEQAYDWVTRRAVGWGSGGNGMPRRRRRTTCRDNPPTGWVVELGDPTVTRRAATCG